MNRAGIVPLAIALGVIPNLHAGTTLSQAAISGSVSEVKTCLDSGEDINEIDKWGLTPLMWAVYYRYLPVVQYLLEHKANPNIQSTAAYGRVPNHGTPLIIAAYYGLDAHAALLLKYGANPELTDADGKRAIDYARYYRFQAVVNLLSKGQSTDKSAAPSTKTTVKTEPQAASSKGKPITNQDVMDMLLAYRGDVYVIQKIKTAPKQALDVSPATLAKLKSLGVSKAVMDAMIQRASRP
jgi:hypothetical protein